MSSAGFLARVLAPAFEDERPHIRTILERHQQS